MLSDKSVRSGAHAVVITCPIAIILSEEFAGKKLLKPSHRA